MPERRSHPRPDAPDRRTFPRPPLWLNLAVLILGVAGVLFARYHRDRVSSSFADVITRQQQTPEDIRRMKEQLAEMDLTREALEKELEGRHKMLANLKQEEFYLSIDTKGRKLRFHYGDTVLREAPVTMGEHREVRSGEKQWTFVPLKGAFPVEAKIVGYDWRVPEWLYALRGEPVPASRPVIPDGLGRYVIFLPNGYVIHSPPADESPLDGAKPGSYMVPAEDLRAIWDRIHKGKTNVYIF